ncbi:MAG: DegV family protein [Firmicutes bacterium]|nr:DegV family protein [Bacillota bacterium]
MNPYTIITDSGCDIDIATLEQWGVKCADLTVRNAEDSRIYLNREVKPEKFYTEMREGSVFQTSAVNPEGFKRVFTEELMLGNDIICICVSGGISTTCQSAFIAAQELESQFPNQKIVVIDSLCASEGEGLLVYLAVEKKKTGATLEELEGYVNETIPSLSHWFTVDDLKYLKRGGRISPTAAFAATVLDIKPVMHVDDEGKLIAMSKVRGRRLAIKALADKYSELAADPDGGIYFISQGDCAGDAAILESMIEEKHGHGAAHIGFVGPVIGAHSGPGTLALFFVGKR